MEPPRRNPPLDQHLVVPEVTRDEMIRGRKVFVQRGVVSEWSREKGDFVPLDKDGVLEDPCLVRPMALRAFFDDTVAAREAWLALEQRGSPEIAAIKEEGRNEGRMEALREGLLKLLGMRFGEVPEVRRMQIEAASGEALHGWLERLLSATTIDGVFGEE
jgi:hypothetical protein